MELFPLQTCFQNTYDYRVLSCGWKIVTRETHFCDTNWEASLEMSRNNYNQRWRVCMGQFSANSWRPGESHISKWNSHVVQWWLRGSDSEGHAEYKKASTDGEDILFPIKHNFSLIWTRAYNFSRNICNCHFSSEPVLLLCCFLSASFAEGFLWRNGSGSCLQKERLGASAFMCFALVGLNVCKDNGGVNFKYKLEAEEETIFWRNKY